MCGGLIRSHGITIRDNSIRSCGITISNRPIRSTIFLVCDRPRDNEDISSGVLQSLNLELSLTI